MNVRAPGRGGKGTPGRERRRGLEGGGRGSAERSGNTFDSPRGGPILAFMTHPSLWDRLRRARVVQVLLVYLGASWAVLQVADVLVDALELPDWVLPVAVLLLAVGLVVVLATAWVQSLPSTTEAEAAGERPTDWEVAPTDALARLKAGRLPHLTWGRAITGGVVALSLLFGAAGVYVALTGGRGILSPAEASAGAAPTAVAVLPFQTRGGEMELYSEGLVDLLSTNLEGLGGLRTINAGSVVARWRRQVGETHTAELDQALRVAGGLNARYAVRGSVVAAGSQVRLVAEIFDLADRSRVESVQVEGPSNEMLRLVDALTVELAGAFVGADENASARTAGVETGSIEALEAYLRGEALYRESRFGESIEALNRAVAADSTFALAWWRLADAWGWFDPAAEDTREASRRAEALSGALPPRQRLLIRADAALNEGRNSYVDELRDHIRLHPEDPDAWNTLGEFAIHLPWLAGSPPDEAPTAFRNAVELVPTFTPYYTHPLGLAVANGDQERFRELLEAYRRHGADAEVVEATEAAWDFTWGSAREMRAAEERLLRAPPDHRGILSLIVFVGDSVGERALEAVEMIQADFPGVPSGYNLLEVNLGRPPAEWKAGELDWPEARVAWSLLAEPEPPPVPGRLVAALDDGPTPPQAVAAAVLAARVGDDDVRRRALAAVDAMDLEGRDVFLGVYRGAATAGEARRSAEAAAHLVAGRPDEARSLLRESMAEPAYDMLTRLLMGDAEWALGDPAEALRHWETLLRSPYRALAHIRTGRAYEELGRTEEALAAYRRFLTMWEEADPSLPPRAEAREAVARLEG